MIESITDKERINFLIPIISKYRIFIAKFIGISTNNVIKILSRRLGIPEEYCHLNNIMSLEDCLLILEELKKFKWELTGVRRIPKKRSVRKYAITVKSNL